MPGTATILIRIAQWGESKFPYVHATDTQHNLDDKPVTCRTETTVMHRFNQPGVFAVSVECSTSDWRVTADSVITIQEPVGEFGAISCFSGNASTDGTKCNALSGEPASFQVAVERGEPVTHNLLQSLTPV